MAGRNPRPGRRPVERLESRTLFAAVFFTGQGDGTTWTDPRNWSDQQVPQAADDVTIAGSVRQVELSKGIQQVHSLTLSTALDVSGGSLTVAAGVQSTATFSISGGDVVLNGTPSTISDLALSGGTLEGDANISLTGGNSVWSGGTMAGTGTTVIQQGGALTVSSGGTLVSSRPLYNDGTLNLTAGSLKLTNLGLHAGTFNLSLGTTLILAGTSEQTFLPPSSVVGDGAVDFTDSVVGLVEGSYHVGATTLDSAPAVRFSSAAAVTGNLTGNGGTLIIGPLPTTRPSRVARKVTGGTLQVLNQHVFTDGITTVLPGWTLEDDSGLLFAGTGSPAIQLYSDPATPGQLVLGGDVSAAGTAQIPRILDFQIGGQSGLINLNGSRSFTVSSGNLLSVNANIGNGSLRSAGSGTLQLLGLNTYGGGTTVASGTGGDLEIHDPASLGTGTVTFAGGALAVRAGLAVTIANAIAAAPSDSINFDVSGGAVTLSGDVSLGSALNVGGTSGSLIVSGAVTLQHDVNVNAAMPVTINGAIGGTFGITKSGPQPLTLGGNSPNMYSGQTEVVAGALVANKSNGPAIPGDLRIDGPASVSLQAPGQLGATSAVTFDSTGGSPLLNLNNTVQSTGSISSFQNGAGSILVGTGTLAVGGGDYSGTLAGNGTLSKIGPGTLTIGQLLQGSALSITGGTVSVARTTPSFSNTVSSLSIGGGRLDLGNSTLVIAYGNGADPKVEVRDYLMSGYAHGAWTGNGIVTTGGTNALGYAESPSGGSLVIEPAVGGDANLDGKVNFSDLLLLAQHYAKPDSFWFTGDFDYDGTVTFADLLSLAQHYGTTSAATATRHRQKIHS